MRLAVACEGHHRLSAHLMCCDPTATLLTVNNYINMISSVALNIAGEKQTEVKQTNINIELFPVSEQTTST